ncbi:MAG: DNA methyltransferase [Desulfomonilaceae bacterium]
MVRRWIENFSYDKNLVVDPSFSSGTTAVAAKKLNRLSVSELWA